MAGNIKYVISSHMKFQKHSLPPLLNSLFFSGVRREDIFVVIGGAIMEGWMLDEKPYRLMVTHNSWEYTGLIEVAKKDLQGEAWFLLHDTCEAGNQFDMKVRDGYNPNVDMTILRGCQCNISLYKHDLLMKYRDLLLSLQGLDKTAAVANEGLFFTRKLATWASYPNDELEIIGEKDIYKNGVVRQINYLKGVDLYKYKANWGQASRAWITNP